MTRLALDQAPVVSLPRRFLFAIPAWGFLAGLLLLIDGDVLLRSRWHPGTLALVHTYTLGVLGNAMFGSLMQFLPAAAGVRLRFSWLGPWMLVGLNAGALLLVAGFYFSSPVLLTLAALLLPLTFLSLAGMTLPGVIQSAGQRLLRAGIGASLAFGMTTALLGGVLALACGGQLSLTMPPWVDVHASLGVLGWVVLLLASVGRIVMPMFQGTGVPPLRWHAAWMIGLLTCLPAAAGWRALGPDDAALPVTLSILALPFALAICWLQRRTPAARRGPLWWSWRAGAVVLALAAMAPLLTTRHVMLAGVLALGLALPWLVVGMMLEIVAFLGWIELHRTVGRGVQLPGVQRLMPARERGAAVLAQMVAGALLALAALHPTPLLARLAGLLVAAAWLGVGLVFVRARRRVRQFIVGRTKAET
ncbi:hypothetical protein DVT68_06735 [Dyella solisilvae]|uniref:NnrS family protein n=1 Tax=Dyella solisilvae TaxID=1920168 RepID=A0A370KCV8_9GAMM|nr:hypothetical protein [Dyella solisilvae]RDJ00484.1 hypothetical protein DVT68_06735 [Dyella solisilvae]